MRKLKPMGRGPGPGPQEHMMVQTGPWLLPRNSPDRASALCSQCQGEVGALENLASVLPNTPDPNWQVLGGPAEPHPRTQGLVELQADGPFLNP